jgi:hypothetical protein
MGKINEIERTRVCSPPRASSLKKKTNLQIVFNDCGKNEMRITPS